MPLAPATLMPKSKEALTATPTTPISTKEELVCILAIIRHGDRTPKQKMKMQVSLKCRYTEKYLRFFHAHGQNPRKELKCKSAVLLQELLDITRSIADQCPARRTSQSDNDHDEVIDKLHQMQSVLEKGGYFSGINRKVQLKPIAWGPRLVEDNPASEVTKLILVLKWGGELTHAGMKQAADLGNKFRSSMYPGESLVRLHSTYRHDLKLYSSDEGRVQMTAACFAKAFLALEGEITPILVSLVSRDHSATQMLDNSLSARDEMNQIKKLLQQVLTGGEDEHSEILSQYPFAASAYLKIPLHPLERLQLLRSHMQQLVAELDVRWQAELDESQRNDDCVTPIEDDSTNNDIVIAFDSETSKLGKKKKSKSNFGPSVVSTNGGGNGAASSSSSGSSMSLGKYVATAKRGDSSRSVGSNMSDCENDGVCGGETIGLMRMRWVTLLKSFYNEKKDSFDCSKIPDIYDCLKYDISHNSGLGLEALTVMFPIAKELAFFVGPLEHGVSPEHKLRLGVKICENLLQKITRDLHTASEQNYHETHQVDHSRLDDGHSSKGKDKVVRTRLYFTSESHIATLLNVIRFGHESGSSSSSGGSKAEATPSTAPDTIDTPGKDLDSCRSASECGDVDSTPNMEHESNPASIITDESETFLRKTNELDYLSHIVVKLFENSSYELGNPKRHRLELWCSTGAMEIRPEIVTSSHTIPIAKLRKLNTNLTLMDFLQHIQDAGGCSVLAPSPVTTGKEQTSALLSSLP